MARSRRRAFVLPEFETCSLALFAALAMSAPSPSRAQASFGPGSRVTATAPAATATPSTPPKRTTTDGITRVFKPAAPASASQAPTKR